MASLYNRAGMSTLTAGTGTITLGTALSAVAPNISSFLSFANAGAVDAQVLSYLILDSNGAWECGRGVYTAAGTTLSRVVLKSSNSNNAINLSGNAQVFITGLAQDFTGTIHPQGRLTLVTGTPVMTSTQSLKTTIFYTPYTGLYLPSYDGTNTNMVSTGGEVSIALDNNAAHVGYHQSGKNFDIFWDDAGSRLVTGPAWTNNTTRATTLEYKNGFLCNAASMTAKFDTSANTTTIAQDRGLYLGTFRASADGQTQHVLGASGTAAAFNLWNMYNRVVLSTTPSESTVSWTYSSATIRQGNGATVLQISALTGYAEDCQTVSVQAVIGLVGGVTASTTIGAAMDSTTTFDVKNLVQLNGTAPIFAATATTAYAPQIGWHVFSLNEQGDGSNANTIYASPNRTCITYIGRY